MSSRVSPVFFVLIFLFLGAQCEEKEKKKNILFLVADDMRPNLGAYEDANSGVFGQPPMYTPNIDALAARSLVFEKAYDAQALCSPSRTSCLTSRRPDTTRWATAAADWPGYRPIRAVQNMSTNGKVCCIW